MRVERACRLKAESHTGLRPNMKTVKTISLGDFMRAPFCVALVLAGFLGTTAQADDSLSRAVQQGAGKGFKTCAPTLDKAVRSIHDDDTKYGHIGTYSVEDSDQRIFNALTSQPYADGRQVTSFTGVKNAAGKCDVV